VVLVGASGDKTRSVDNQVTTDRSFDRNTGELNLAPAVIPDVVADPVEPQATSSGAAFQLNWYSFNGGGVTNASSTNYQVGMTVGQSVAGEASGTNYEVGIGFWYGATAGGGTCPIALSGDVNLSTTLTSADIIFLVNFVFKGGAVPMPCEANGDVNCTGAVTSADIIFMVNHVFKGQDAPCDICNDPGAQACV
jgi:hypothetical protein